MITADSLFVGLTVVSIAVLLLIYYFVRSEKGKNVK